jgi:hypothetical protein
MARGAGTQLPRYVVEGRPGADPRSWSETPDRDRASDRGQRLPLGLRLLTRWGGRPPTVSMYQDRCFGAQARGGVRG